MRLSAADAKLIAALKTELGVSASAEILRMGLHALARKHGVKG